MVICPACRRELKDNHLFCGYCGAELNAPSDIIIDGKKNKTIKRIVNSVCRNNAVNIAFTLLFLFLTVLSVWELVTVISALVNSSYTFGEVFNQLCIKYGYVKEGLGMGYIRGEIEYIYSYIINIIIAGGCVFTAVISIFYMIFNTDILYLKIKHRDNYAYKKPLRYMKVCSWAVKLTVTAIPVFIGVMLVLYIIKLIIV